MAAGVKAVFVFGDGGRCERHGELIHTNAKIDYARNVHNLCIGEGTSLKAANPDVYLNDKNINKNRFLVNETHVGISVKPHTSGTIYIIGTSAVPEFPIFIPLFVALTAVIILQFRSKLNLRQNHMNKNRIRRF